MAAASLELLTDWCDIEAVITKPQPAHHREKFPVIAVAEAHGLDLHFASNRRELDDLMAGIASENEPGSPFKSRVAILIDYGIIVSQGVIDSFSLGIVNSHFSLLPEWRGADPITFSILSGQPETGVSLMLLVQAMDEGPLLAQAPYKLSGSVTASQLTQDLIELSNHSLQQVIPLYLDGKTEAAPQDQVAMDGHETPSYSRKLSKADSVLDFSKPAVQLEREIRAFADWPKSRMVLGGKDIVITKAHVVVDKPTGSKPGVVEVIKETAEVMVASSDGWLAIDKLKPAGKPEMDSRAFLAGNKF